MNREEIVAELINIHRSLENPLQGNTEFVKGQRSSISDILKQLSESGDKTVKAYSKTLKADRHEN